MTNTVIRVNSCRKQICLLFFQVSENEEAVRETRIIKVKQKEGQGQSDIGHTSQDSSQNQAPNDAGHESQGQSDEGSKGQNYTRQRKEVNDIQEIVMNSDSNDISNNSMESEETLDEERNIAEDDLDQMLLDKASHTGRNRTRRRRTQHRNSIHSNENNQNAVRRNSFDDEKTAEEDVDNTLPDSSNQNTKGNRSAKEKSDS